MRLSTLLVCACMAGSASAITWNPSADWVDGANPFGTWRMYKNPSDLFSIYLNPWVPGEGQPAWADQQVPGLAHVPMWCMANGTFPTNFDVPPGTILMHGAETWRTGTEISFLRWTSPITGTVHVCGEIWMPGSEARVMNCSVLVNGVPVTNGQVSVWAPYSSQNPLRFEDFSGGQGALEVQVTPGTTIDILCTRDPASTFAYFVAGYYGISTHPFNTNLMVDGELQDFVGDEMSIPITVSILDSSGRTIREKVMHLSSESALPLMACLEGDYTVCVKASHWLRQCQTVNFGEFGADVYFSLTNGDVDGDNEVAIGDYAQLSASYGSFVGDSNWNPNADLNGDEEVGISDYAILSQNYGMFGD